MPVNSKTTFVVSSSSLIRPDVLIQELLHRLKQLHAVFFHDDGVRAFADLDIALVRCVDEFGEIGVQHVAGGVSVPLGVR